MAGVEEKDIDRYLGVVSEPRNVGCLPVVRDGRLLGIVTERDFMVLTRELLVQMLQE
jgi:CBS domain-containing protein